MKLLETEEARGHRIRDKRFNAKAAGSSNEILGGRSTVAIALPPFPEDEGLNIIRLDGLIRANANVSMGDRISVRPADVQPAKRVSLAPAQKNVRLMGSGAALLRTLLQRPVVAGDVVSTSVYRQTPDMDQSLFPEEIFRRFVEQRAYGLQEIRLIITSTLPKGVLLHGPPGTGKTLLARAIASESEAAFYHIAGPEIMGRYYGESEERLREAFSEARQNSPAIIFIDEIDSIAPKREEVTGETERRVVAQLLTLLDGLEPRQNVVVIGATNRIDALDEALRRPGRFDREIVIGVPDVEGRRQIIGIHTRGMPLAGDVDVEELSRITYGFVGADLAALAREAAIEALRRNLPKIDLHKTDIPEEVLENLVVTWDDFTNALKRVQPSALREIMIQVPDVHWGDVGGLEEAKQALREGIEMPLKAPESFQRIGIRPAKGFLLFGPPGTGKTLVAKAVAREAEANFVATKSSDLLSKWYGESEKQIARLFQRSRQVAPTVIFIDELDALAPRRGSSLGEPAVTERVVNTLLAELDGLEELQGVIVIGATNRPNLLDPALLRPGRFDELIYIPVPSEEGRLRILQIHTRDMPLDDDVDLGKLAADTPRYTGADLENLVRRAGMLALREDSTIERIPMRLFQKSLTETRASVTPEMEKDYERLAEELKQERPLARRQLGFTVDGE